MVKETKLLTLLFLKRQDEVLLALKKRGCGVGRWDGAGGKVEVGETIEQAAIRETQEEIGVTPTEYEKVADIRFDEYFKGKPTIMHVHVYIATVWEGEPSESEEMRPEWYGEDNLPLNDMWPDIPHWLPLVFEGKKISANFTLDTDDELTHQDVKIVGSL